MNIKLDYKKLLYIPQSRMEKFHERTKLKKLRKDVLSPQNWPNEWKTVFFKGYSRFEEIPLPDPKKLDKINLNNILYSRQSCHKFSKKILPFESLSSLLFYSAGQKRKSSSPTANRFYPSAGSRYPLEIYPISLNTNLSRGLYHYYIKNHSLEFLLPFTKFNFSLYLNQPSFKNASVLLIITAVFKRTTIKYGDRSYRHILIEAGHLGQNIYLLSASLGLTCCAIGGYNDESLNKLLDVDGITEAVIYVLAVGTI